MEASNHNKLLCQTLLWFIIWINISPVQEVFSLVTCWRTEALPVSLIMWVLSLIPLRWCLGFVTCLPSWWLPIVALHALLSFEIAAGFGFHFPPLDHNVDFHLVTHVSIFRLYVKCKSKFTKFISEVNLVWNLNIFILCKQTVNCFSLRLMKAPLWIYTLM